MSNRMIRQMPLPAKTARAAAENAGVDLTVKNRSLIDYKNHCPRRDSTKKRLAKDTPIHIDCPFRSKIFMHGQPASQGDAGGAQGRGAIDAANRVKQARMTALHIIRQERLPEVLPNDAKHILHAKRTKFTFFRLHLLRQQKYYIRVLQEHRISAPWAQRKP